VERVKGIEPSSSAWKAGNFLPSPLKPAKIVLALTTRTTLGI
jgi:hypothetical protein